MVYTVGCSTQDSLYVRSGKVGLVGERWGRDTGGVGLTPTFPSCLFCPGLLGKNERMFTIEQLTRNDGEVWVYFYFVYSCHI